MRSTWWNTGRNDNMEVVIQACDELEDLVLAALFAWERFHLRWLQISLLAAVSFAGLEFCRVLTPWGPTLAGTALISVGISLIGVFGIETARLQHDIRRASAQPRA